MRLWAFSTFPRLPWEARCKVARSLTGRKPWCRLSGMESWAGLEVRGRTYRELLHGPSIASLGQMITTQHAKQSQHLLGNRYSNSDMRLAEPCHAIFLAASEARQSSHISAQSQRAFQQPDKALKPLKVQPQRTYSTPSDQVGHG